MFTCVIRLTCGWCGHIVCANEEHGTYSNDVFAAMADHKRTHFENKERTS